MAKNPLWKLQPPPQSMLFPTRKARVGIWWSGTLRRNPLGTVAGAGLPGTTVGVTGILWVFKGDVLRIWLVVSNIFFVHPYLGLAYFSDGLKPPPSDGLRIFIMGFRIHHTCFTSNLGKMFLFFHVFPTTLFCLFWWKDVFDLEFCCNETSDQTPTWPTITSIFLLDLCFGNRKISVSHHYWPI